MPVWKAAFYGVIQGITSVLPVSSSGHIALFGRLLGDPSAGTLSFMVYLHIGTLIAVVRVFRKDILRLVISCFRILTDLFTDMPVFFRNLFQDGNGALRPIARGTYRRFFLILLLTAVVETGISLIIRNFTFLGVSNLLITAMGFFVTALLLFISSYTAASKNSPAKSGFGDAVLGGVFQGFSAMPGVSRLGMALAAGSLSGFGKTYLAKYAFLTCISAIAGSMIWVLPSAQAATENSPGTAACITGIIVSALVSSAMLRVVRRILSRKTNRMFSVYTVVIGILCIVLYFR